MRFGDQQGTPIERGMTTAIATVVMVGLVITFGIAKPYIGEKRDGAQRSGWLRGDTDCNRNGIPDRCDIAVGVSVDCNGNGVPDECDIAGDTSDDCNNNLVPDECEASTPHGLVGTYVGTFTGVPGWEDNCEPMDNFEPVDPFAVVRGRIDPTVDFDWGGYGGSGRPWPGFHPNDFEITWSGYVDTPDATGDYTFYTRTDDGVRLWVDGQLIIDEWYDQPATEHSGVIALEGEQVYRIVMEYYEAGGQAVAELRWQKPGGPKVIIPTQRLLPYLDCNDNGVPDDCDIEDGSSTDANGNGIPDECEIVPGDLNCDGVVDFGDINPFALLLANPAAWEMAFPGCPQLNGDINGDGEVDFGDINPFVALLSG